MRKLLVLMAVLSMFTTSAQEIPEPEFIGEVMIYNASNNTTTKLPKERSTVKTKASATMYITGFGVVASRLHLEGEHSIAQFSQNSELYFVIKAENNNIDPMSIIQIFKFDKVNSDSRSTELTSNSTFGGHSDNNKQYANFSAKKHGQSSYIITFKPTVGEYGIIANSMDAVNSIVATFGIYEHQKPYLTKQEAYEAKMKEVQRLIDSKERVRLAKKENRKQRRILEQQQKTQQ
jgi:hypothetical protein